MTSATRSAADAGASAPSASADKMPARQKFRRTTNFPRICACAATTETRDHDGKRGCRCHHHDAGTRLAHALPGLTAAEHAAEGATLHAKGHGALHRYRRVVVAATVGIVDAAGPLPACRGSALRHLRSAPP